MSREKIKDAVLVLALIILILFTADIFFNYVLGLILPFVISYVAVYFSDRTARRLETRGLKFLRLSRLVIALLTLAAICVGTVFFIRQICILAFGVIGGLLEGDNLAVLLQRATVPIKASLGGMLPDKLSDVLIDALRAFLSSIVSKVGTFVTDIAAALPKFLLGFVITVISIIYLSLDFERIHRSVGKMLSPKIRSTAVFIRKRFLDVGIRYVRSYALIMGVTFCTVLTGFLILSIKNAVTLALLIAVLDLLPVIGVGTVIVPWGIYSLISGDIFRGVGLLILFLINEIIRQYSEPKIVGKNLDMHPMLTLALIYCSVTLFGARGVLLVPILAVVINVAAERIKQRNKEEEQEDGG